MVGQALKKVTPQKDTYFLSSADADLRSWEETQKIFQLYQPTHVYHLAARVGGIEDNKTHLGDFYRDNILLNTNVLECCRQHKVIKAISLLSTCVFPDKVTYPLTETQVHEGEPHNTNFGYAYAKRMLDVQSRAYRQQYGCNFITAIPNNLYGYHDNFHLEKSHVIPALIRKIYEARHANHPSVEVWGDGKPLREFTFSEDVANVLTFLMKEYNDPYPINIGNTNETPIKAVVELLCHILDYRGEIVWNTKRPSGQHRKPSSNEKLRRLGWKEEGYTTLESGLKKTCEWFIMNYPKIRGV